MIKIQRKKTQNLTQITFRIMKVNNSDSSCLLSEGFSFLIYNISLYDKIRLLSTRSKF